MARSNGDGWNSDPAGSTEVVARPIEPEARAALLGLAADLTLQLDADGIVRAVSHASPSLREDGAFDWIGRPLIDLVTVEGRPKIAELLADAGRGAAPRWRQVTHVLPSGEVPIRYACVASGDSYLAIGREMRAEAIAQQRMLQAQQSLERDYLRLRQSESRYRLLFDLADEPILMVAAANWRITEANPAAHRILGAAPGTLAGQPAGMIARGDQRESLVAHLGAAAAGISAGMPLHLRDGDTIDLSATAFRHERATHLLVRLHAQRGSPASGGERGFRSVIEQMPDAFVLTGRSLAIVSANAAFLDLAGAAAPEAVIGQPLGRWLGRPGVDLELILAELRRSGSVRNIATVVRGGADVAEEVELSAVLVEGDGEDHFGFVLRGVARRLRDLPPAERDLPRSVEQLTELVGRVSLKEIVRESTDLIERLCIEAALAYTSDNRASAAEVLGLSRQGLYSKLHRHGLGNLVDDGE